MTLFSNEISTLSIELILLCKEKNLLLATAESCTGGLIAAALTEISGSSQVLDRGFVTYSNQAKHEMLGVKNETLHKFGAVSEEVAFEMVCGAIAHSRAQIAVAVTGIAGPKGGSIEKPVGLVYIAVRYLEKAIQQRHFFIHDSRYDVRSQTLLAALRSCIHILG